MKSQDETILREFLYEVMCLSSSHKILTTKSKFYSISPAMLDREYVTNILGIDLPLNETYPYTGPIYSKILKEQKQLEDFLRSCDSDVSLVVEHAMLYEQDEGETEDKSGWPWTKAARLAGDVKTGAAAYKMMAADKSGGKIQEFVDAALEIIMEPYETLKQFFTTLVEKGKEWGVKVFQKIGEFSQKIWGWITKAVDYVKGMSGWKQALAASTVVVGLMYIWKEYGPDFVKPAMDKINEFNAIVAKYTGKGGKKNESYIHASGLITAMHSPEDDELINEWNPLKNMFGKKKKKGKDDKGKEGPIDKEEKGDENLSDEEKEQKRKDQAKQKSEEAKTKEETNKAREDMLSDPEGAAEAKAEELKNTWWGQLGLTALPDNVKEKGKEIITWLKDKLIKGLWEKAKGLFSGMAKEAASSAATGGFGAFIKGIGKLYSGTAFAMKILRPALQQAAEPAEIKDEIAEEGGEEQFWAQGTNREDKVDKKGKEKQNEALLRELIKEALLLKETRYARKKC